MIEKTIRKLEKREDKYDPEQALRRRTGRILHCICNLPFTVAFTAAIFTVFWIIERGDL